MNNAKNLSLICINCPMGCDMNVVIDENRDVLSVEGNACPLGEKYAQKEVKDPRRVVCSTVLVDQADQPTVSVKTSEAVPKDRIFDVMHEINTLHAHAPVAVGEVLKHDVAHTGADIVATMRVEKSANS